MQNTSGKCYFSKLDLFSGPLLFVSFITYWYYIYKTIANSELAYKPIAKSELAYKPIANSELAYKPIAKSELLYKTIANKGLT